MNSEYGLGKTPPYSLYENEIKKWGLVDGNGNKLPAIFLTKSMSVYFLQFPGR